MQPQHAFTYPEPEAPDAGATIWRALLEQFTNVGSGSACPGNNNAFSPLASGQVPIAGFPSVSNSNMYVETLLQVFPQIAENASEAPRVLNDSNAFETAKSVGEEAEPLLRYWDELRAVREAFHERRGSDAQEKFMFDVVAPFIEKSGVQGIRDIDVTLEAMPRTAKYYFPYLLGHIEHEATQQERRNLLERYRESDDEDVRDGAIEALGYLAAS